MEEVNYKRTSWGLNEQEEDEQTLRENLIQCAQTRLRYLQLEENLRNVLQTVISMQTKLETLRVDTATTLDTVSTVFDGSKSPEITQKMNRQMDVLERRLESHRSYLQTLHQPQFNTEPMEKLKSSSSSSRFSSLSSIFGRRQDSISTCATSVDGSLSKQMDNDDDISHIESLDHEEEDHPFYDLAGKRSFGTGSFCGSVYHDHHEPVTTFPTSTSSVRSRRRQRRQQHIQQQQRMDDDSVCSQDLSSYSNDIHPLSPSLPPYCAVFDTAPIEQWYHQNMFEEQEKWSKDLFSQRNVLDEAMSFLDGLGEDGDDGGFGEDMYVLLRNPDLCCKPLSEIETTIKELRQQEDGIQWKQVIQLLKPTFWIQLAFKYTRFMIYHVTCSGLDWCRFLSILAAAVVISLLKGPEDIKRKTY